MALAVQLKPLGCSDAISRSPGLGMEAALPLLKLLGGKEAVHCLCGTAWGPGRATWAAWNIGLRCPFKFQGVVFSRSNRCSFLKEPKRKQSTQRKPSVL